MYAIRSYYASAFSLAAARLGWALQDVDCISLHGRPASLIVPHLAPGARILALTSGAETVLRDRPDHRPEDPDEIAAGSIT